MQRFIDGYQLLWIDYASCCRSDHCIAILLHAHIQHIESTSTARTNGYQSYPCVHSCICICTFRIAVYTAVDLFRYLVCHRASPTQSRRPCDSHIHGDKSDKAERMQTHLCFTDHCTWVCINFSHTRQTYVGLMTTYKQHIKAYAKLTRAHTKPM